MVSGGGRWEERYVTAGLLPDPVRLPRHEGGVCSTKGFAPRRWRGYTSPSQRGAERGARLYPCTIREAFWQEKEDMLHSSRRMVAGRREIQGKFQKSPLELPRHT